MFTPACPHRVGSLNPSVLAVSHFHISPTHGGLGAQHSQGLQVPFSLVSLLPTLPFGSFRLPSYFTHSLNLLHHLPTSPYQQIPPLGILGSSQSYTNLEALPSHRTVFVYAGEMQ